MKYNRIPIVIILTLAVTFSFLYQKILRSNTQFNDAKKVVYIPTKATYQQLISILHDSAILKNEENFHWLASKMNLTNHVHPGRYEITGGMNNYQMVHLFKNGIQSPVRFVINKFRTRKDIIRRLDEKFEPQAALFDSLLSDTSYLSKWDILPHQIQALMVPATYYIYWNAPPHEIINKIGNAYTELWDSSRTHKAQKIGLSPIQVITIASIVEEETNQQDEKSKIAAVYLNRYRIGMNLGADPTVKFAVGDFALKRILNIHTAHPSAYNTYQHSGLPPGPICTPSKESIDAVLNPDQNNYLYFCAKEDFSGYHNFAATYDQHLANARKYQQALNARGIR